jgi:hypothetical protein
MGSGWCKAQAGGICNEQPMDNSCVNSLFTMFSQAQLCGGVP